MPNIFDRTMVPSSLRKSDEVVYKMEQRCYPFDPVACENGYCESFNSGLRNEYLNDEVFYSYETVRQHSYLGWR